MPPWEGVAGFMVVSLFGNASGRTNGFEDWKAMGKWESGLANGRRESSPEIKKKTAEITPNPPTTLAKIPPLAQFPQNTVPSFPLPLVTPARHPHPPPHISSPQYSP